MMELRRRRARAKAISCLWPWEKLAPPADTLVSSVIMILVSTSVAGMDEESTVSSRSLVWTDGGRDAVRLGDDAVLWSWGMCCDSCVLGVMIWTRDRTSRHSLSVCSPTKNNGHLTENYTVTCDAYTYRMDQDCLLKSLKRVLHPRSFGQSRSICSTQLLTWGINVFLRYRQRWDGGKSIDDKRRHTNRERKSCIPIVDISIPSIMIRPLIGSTYGRVREREDYMD